MGNAWTDHYQKEAQTNKMMYDMVSATYQECQAKWDALAKEHGVTLTDDSNEKVEIALMADAALIDIHRYIGEKWSEVEAQSLVTDIRGKYEVGDEEYESWKKVRITP